MMSVDELLLFLPILFPCSFQSYIGMLEHPHHHEISSFHPSKQNYSKSTVPPHLHVRSERVPGRPSCPLKMTLCCVEDRRGDRHGHGQVRK